MPDREFTISRDYDAPRDLVWSCFTDVERMSHWWGPKGITIINARMDLRPGGVFHYGMKSPDGSIMWGRMVYREIVVPERIAFINSFSDESARLTRAPFFDGKWPLEMLSTFTFDDVAPRQTRFTVTWTPHNASTEEQAVFAANFPSMTGGWTGTLDKLAAYVASISGGDRSA